MDKQKAKANKTKPLVFIIMICGCVGIWGAIIVGGFMVLWLRGVNEMQTRLSNTTVTPVFTSREIAQNSLPLAQRWRTRTYLPAPFDGMVATNQYLITQSLGKSVTRSSLQVFYADTGSLAWTIDDFHQIGEISADTSNIYLATLQQIYAYDLKSGTLLWKSAVPNKIFDMHANNEAFFVYSTLPSFRTEEMVIYVFDTASGAIQERARIQVPADTGGRLLGEDQDQEYWSGNDTIWAARKSGNDILWQVPIEYSADLSLVESNREVFLLKNGRSYFSLIDRFSGKAVWETSKEIISNAAIVEGVIYAIQLDGSLIGIDIKTGKEIGKAEISPTTNTETLGTDAYIVSAYGNMLYAYWGDSQDVIAFDVLSK